MELIDQLLTEFEKPKSKRSKKVVNKATSDIIKEIESEIIRLNYYLTTKVISDPTYRPCVGDVDHHKRERCRKLIELVKKIKNEG